MDTKKKEINQQVIAENKTSKQNTLLSFLFPQGQCCEKCQARERLSFFPQMYKMVEVYHI
jgi:hypothetical protein